MKFSRFKKLGLGFDMFIEGLGHKAIKLVSVKNNKYINFCVYYLHVFTMDSKGSILSDTLIFEYLKCVIY